jgi:predicted Zn finger-like uncharacterized protein
MLIVCPHCATEHDVPEGDIGLAGRKVRCRGCREVWQAAPAESAGAAPDTVSEAAIPAPEPAAEVLPPEALGATPAEDTPAPSRPRKPASPRKQARRRRAAASPARPWRLRPALIALGVLVAITVLIGLRVPIVRAAPQTARLYAALAIPVNLRGLDIANLTSRLYTEGGNRLLVVEGAITNVTSGARPVPALRFAVRDGKGAELYVWTARLDKHELAAGELLFFRNRLAAPPSEGRNVEVRFIDNGGRDEPLAAREGGAAPRS